jgi:hypothetical protein
MIASLDNEVKIIELSHFLQFHSKKCASPTCIAWHSRKAIPEMKVFVQFVDRKTVYPLDDFFDIVGKLTPEKFGN